MELDDLILFYMVLGTKTIAISKTSITKYIEVRISLN